MSASSSPSRVGLIDRKFNFSALNPVNGNRYTEDDALILCAKDACVPTALRAYHKAAVKLKCNAHHIASIELLIARVDKFQREIQVRTPDTVGEEIPRCISGKAGGGYELKPPMMVLRENGEISRAAAYEALGVEDPEGVAVCSLDSLSALEERVAGELYDTYCAAVGGLAFNGDPLPAAAEFLADPTKQKQADAWREVARKSLDLNPPQ